MERLTLSKLIGVLTILSLLLFPSSPARTVLAEPAAGPDDEIIYIDSAGIVRVIDRNVEIGNQPIEWFSPDGGWFDFATGDFNNDGDKEIVLIGNNKLTVFDPVVRDTSITPDGTVNLVPWKRLHERALNSANIIAAGNLDQGAPGDEIIVGYNVSEAGGVNYRVDVLKTGDGGRTWTTHLSQGFGAPWTYIKVGNINNVGSDDLLLGRTTAGDALVEAHEVDNNFATIFAIPDGTLFTQRDGAIGQIYGGGTGETVTLRTFSGTTEAAAMLIYQFINGSWQNVEDTNNPQTDDSAHYFPHPFKIVVGDINGSGDDEIIWLREAPTGDGTTVRLAMINRGGDALPSFETPLDADNGYRTLAMGDPDGDGRKELAAMRDNRIRYFYAVESGNTALFVDYSNISTNRRSLQMANLDGSGYTAGARFSVSPTSLSETLEAGTSSTKIYQIQLTNIGSGGNLPITVVKGTSATWFNFSVGSGTTPASIFIDRFDASNLSPGTYRDKLQVTSSNQNVLDQPFEIPIELVVTEASFSLSPANFSLVMSTSESLTKTKGVAVNGLPGLGYSAAIMGQPEFSAAASALGNQPTRAHFAESGALVLGNGNGEYTTTVTRSAPPRASNSARAISASEWPSGLTWASATSAGVVAPDTITIAISPTLMTGNAGNGVLLVLADERAGTFPDNLKIVEFLALKTDTPVFLPILSR